jgi:hypothetical protein
MTTITIIPTIDELAWRAPRREFRSMSRGQAATLRTLSVEAYQPKLFEENLSREEADLRIEALRQEIALANSL